MDPCRLLRVVDILILTLYMAVFLLLFCSYATMLSFLAGLPSAGGIRVSTVNVEPKGTTIALKVETVNRGPLTLHTSFSAAIVGPDGRTICWSYSSQELKPGGRGSVELPLSIPAEYVGLLPKSKVVFRVEVWTLRGLLRFKVRISGGIGG